MFTLSLFKMYLAKLYLLGFTIYSHILVIFHSRAFYILLTAIF